MTNAVLPGKTNKEATASGKPGRGFSLCKKAFGLCLLFLSLSAHSAADGNAFAVWWWSGKDASDRKEYMPRFDFLAKQGINEIFFWVHKQTAFDDIVAFVREAHRRNMRISWLSGDVSFIRPENTGFEELLSRFVDYQRKAPADARFHALHLDVEPHQDGKYSNARRWQLYADFVLRASACVHAFGERIEWDIPFWLEAFKVQYGYRDDVPLLEVVMDHSDGVTLMSYRNTAEQMLKVSETELGLGASRPCRVLLGAETDKSSEGDFVSYHSVGAVAMKRELAKVRQALSSTKMKAGTGIAVHHLGSWQQLKD